MASYLITGASRGIGLALATALAARPASEVRLIIATARSTESAEFNELLAQHPNRVKYVQLEVTSADSISEAASEVEAILGKSGLDVLVNNAGTMPFTPHGVETMDNLDETLRTNVVSAHNVTAAFIKLLQSGSIKTVINISTTLGSMSMAKKFLPLRNPAYKISKAAMSMLTVQYALDFEDRGFNFVALSPGWVRTDLGGKDIADLTPPQSATACLEIIDRACRDKTMNGKFFDIHVSGWEENPGLNQYAGGEVPW